MSRMTLSCLMVAALLLPATVRADDDADLMKACPGLAGWAAMHPHVDEANAREDAGRRVTDPALRRELAARGEADQRARDTALAAGMRDPVANKAMLVVDADNLAWLKAVVARQGFPTPEAVGAQGVANAWLLVQHADRDPAFQAAVLKTLESRLAGSGVRKADVAMLTDRVLLAQGKLQRYGSQFKPSQDGSPVSEPTEDMAHVDQRRASMDLMPLADYRCMLHFSYAPAQATDARAQQARDVGTDRQR